MALFEQVETLEHSGNLAKSPFWPLKERKSISQITDLANL
jgi:hypothetical protein